MLSTTPAPPAPDTCDRLTARGNGVVVVYVSVWVIGQQALRGRWGGHTRVCPTHARTLDAPRTLDVALSLLTVRRRQPQHVCALRLS
jgi:hypothetical protein